ncbi:MAG: hypothetical protein HY907_15550, partial [Deltaproteobacteria bacterium]|nr:hypothetical protein [Deltaproteobacteria bacterium]
MPAGSKTAGGEFEAARERAEEALRGGDLDGALKQFRALLFQFEAWVSGAARADVYARMAGIKAQQRDGKQARNLFEKALAIDAAHRPSLEGLVEVFAAEGDHVHLVEARRRLAELLSGEERIRVLLEAGETCAARLGDVPQAILFYQEALTLDQGHKLAQLRLFQACRDAEMWAEAIAAAEGILASEPEAPKRATWHFFLATTWHDHAGDEEKALAEFEKVLDEDPGDAESMAAIERLRTAAEDWAGLDESWRRQLERLSGRAGTEGAREALLHELGENARLRLGDLERAAGYHARALELNPDHRARRELLAGLYAQIPGRWADAVREHQRLLRGDPKRIESYHRMRGILRDAGRADETWCVCAALATLGRADPTEVQFYEQYRPKGALGTVGGVDAEAWERELVHPNQDRDVSRVLAAAAGAIAKGWAQSAKEFGLRKQDLQDVRTSGLALAKALRQVSGVLDVPVPELYVVPHQAGGLIFAMTDPAASVAGQDFLAGLSQAELRFVAGHHMATYRREHAAAFMLAAAAGKLRQPLPGVLLDYVQAAVAVGAGEGAIELTEARQQAMKVLRAGLTPLDLDVLGPAAEALAARPPPDMTSWLRRSDLTCDRAGLLLCGDLPVATQMLGRVPVLSPGLLPNRRGDDLLLFSVSDEHFRLRRAL